MYKRNLVFAAACTGLLLFGIMLITLGSILPSLSSRFQLNELNAGELASVFPIGILIGSLVFGPLADRYGYKIILIVSTLLACLGFQFLAYAQTFSFLQAGIFIIGFGGGVINGATNALVADISTEDKGANLSLLGVFFGIGALGMPLVLAFLLKYFRYQAILSAVGFFHLFVIVYFMVIKFPLPKQGQGFLVKEGVKLLKEPVLLLIGFFLFFQSGIEALMNNWTTTFLQTGIKAPEKDSLFALSCLVGGLTLARLLLGFLLKKISSFTVMFSSLMLTAVGSFILLNAGSYTMALTALIILGAGLAAGFPVMLGYTGQLYAKLSGTAFSIALVIALLGNTLINYFFGIISHDYGVRQLPVFLLAAIACMIILLLAVQKNITSKLKA